MAISSVSNASTTNLLLQSQDSNTAPLSLSQQQPPLSQQQLSELSTSVQQAIQSAFQSGGSASQIQSQVDSKVSSVLSSAGISPSNQQSILNNFNQAMQQSGGSQHHMHRGAGRAGRQAIQSLMSSQSSSDPSSSTSSTSSTSPLSDALTTALAPASSTSSTVGQNLNALA